MKEPGTEVPYFIAEPICYSEVTRLSVDIKKPWLKATLKDIKKLFNNQNFYWTNQKRESLCLHVWMSIRQIFSLTELLTN